MCERAVVLLVSGPRAPRLAREFVAERCAEWRVEHSDRVALLTSELVTNAVVHAAGEIALAISLTGSVIEVGVCDETPDHPVVRAQRHDLLGDLDAFRIALDDGRDASSYRQERGQGRHPDGASSVLGGRGLLIVQELAQDWGVAARDGGKEVWFSLPAEIEGRDCPCGDGGFPLPSGRLVTTSRSRR
jgi:anti-sigma regulatory factor (Ser/Thr protein kinase)